MEEEKNIPLSTLSSSRDKSFDQLPQTKIGQKKREVIYVFWFELIGTFVITFGVYASNINGLVIAAMYGIMIMLAQNQKCTFNPALTFMFAFKESGLWVPIALFAQFLGAFIAAMIGYFNFNSQIQNCAYLYATIGKPLLGDAFGEIVGSSILALGVLLQYDELLDFSKDRLETGLIVGGLYGFGRILAYKSQSSLNPAMAFGLEFFESIKDGQWDRFSMVWIFILGPCIGALVGSQFVRMIYRPQFEKQLKIGLK